MKYTKIFMSVAIVSLLLFSTLAIAVDNSPPSRPTNPTGPSVVEIGTLHSWAVGRSYDPDGDYISYLWDWDDGDRFQTCYIDDDDFIIASHIYLTDGTYDIQVKAIDFHESESDWSVPFTVDVSGIDISTDKDTYEQGDTGICTIENTLSDIVSITLFSIVPDVEPLKSGLDYPYPILIEPYGSYDCLFLIENMFEEHYQILVEYEYNGLPCSGSTDFDVIQPNEPPNKPSTPEGPSNGIVGVEYCFNSTSIDPDGDMVNFTFDWGDGNISVTPQGPASVSLCHSWEYAGEYNVRSKSKDAHGAESEWSDNKTVTITEEEEPESDIDIDIRGGLAVVASITNNGTIDITNVYCNVTVEGSRIFRGFDQSYDSTFDNIDVGATKTIRIPGRNIKWFGRVTITVIISYDSESVSKAVNGFVVGPFVIIRS